MFLHRRGGPSRIPMEHPAHDHQPHPYGYVWPHAWQVITIWALECVLCFMYVRTCTVCMR